MGYHMDIRSLISVANYLGFLEGKGQIEIAEEEATKNKDHNLAKNYRDQINRINNLDIVNGLAKYNVIPGYGFPLDVVPLKIYDKVRRRFNTALDLNRDLSLALSEYAPDSEIAKIIRNSQDMLFE